MFLRNFIKTIFEYNKSTISLRYLLELKYNGENFHGWQRQPNASSIQQTVEEHLSTILNEKISLVGAGRTDSGVHAKYYCAHFDYNNKISSKNDFIFKLNSFLNKDISIINIHSVNENFHARFDAISRSYEYLITTEKDPFSFNSAYYVKKDLDFEKMNLASNILYNYNNFKCFSKSNSDVKTFNCTITNAKWVRIDNTWVFQISANRFLRNMVRAIVGTLIDIGDNKYDINHIEKVIKSENRELAGFSVPAHGLYLTNIIYPRF